MSKTICMAKYIYGPRKGQPCTTVASNGSVVCMRHKNTPVSQLGLFEDLPCLCKHYSPYERVITEHVKCDRCQTVNCLKKMADTDDTLCDGCEKQLLFQFSQNMILNQMRNMNSLAIKTMEDMTTEANNRTSGYCCEF